MSHRDIQYPILVSRCNLILSNCIWFCDVTYLALYKIIQVDKNQVCYVILWVLHGVTVWHIPDVTVWHIMVKISFLLSLTVNGEVYEPIIN